MNIEEIDKWLDNEYGVSYTRLEELHDFVVEQDLKHREEKDKEIDRLNNIIDELEKWLEENIKISKAHNNNLGVNVASIFLDKLKELKENNKDVC